MTQPDRPDAGKRLSMCLGVLVQKHACSHLYTCRGVGNLHDAAESLDKGGLLGFVNDILLPAGTDLGEPGVRASSTCHA